METVDNPIFSRWHWDGAVGMPKFNCVRNNLALGIHLDEFEATVRVKGGPDVKAFFGSKVPRLPSGWLGMNEDATTNWPEGSFVEVERPVEEFPCRDFWIDG
jgi:hypothetical protein